MKFFGVMVMMMMHMGDGDDAVVVYIECRWF